MRTITLKDESEVQCKTNKSPVNFARLKIYQEGKSWYQKLGYLPKNQKSYEEQLSIFRNYPFTQLKEELSIYKPASNEKRFFKRLTEQFEKFVALEKVDPTISEFMSWLWESDCPTYQRLDVFLFESQKSIKFSALYPEAGMLTKELSKE